MGTVTCVIDDAVEERTREYLWKKYRGKGKHMSEVISQALTEYLEKHENEVK